MQCHVATSRGDAAQNPCRISCYNRKRRNILGNNRPSTDSAAFSNCVSRENDGASADPAILFNDNRLADLGALTPLAFLRINRQSCREDTDVWPNHAVIANLDLAHVVDCTVASDSNLMANRDVIAVVTSKRFFDSDISTHTAYIGDRRGFSGRNPNGVTRLQDFEKQTGTFFVRYTVKGVESPASGRATLTL